MEAELEANYQKLVKAGLPCQQGLCGRRGCPTCLTQARKWRTFWRAMGLSHQKIEALRPPRNPPPEEL